MNRKDIINKFYDRIDTGWLNIKPKGIPLQSVDNSQESMGKLFMALTDKEKQENKKLISMLTDGIKNNLTNEIGSCFLPRVKVIAFNEPEESKENLWEKIAPRTWIRTDVSYSQFTYLLQGLRLVDANITNKALIYITENDFVIKRHDGKLASNGNFNLWWNPIVSLRKYFIKELTGAKHSVMEKFWFKLMPYLPWSTEKDNGLNLLLVYYSIGGMSKSLKQKMKYFIDKWMSEFQVKELKDELHYLLLDKIRSEL